MTGEEKRELQDLLAEGIKQRGQTPDDILRDTDVPLDEDSGQFFVTQHERIVFQLECKRPPPTPPDYNSTASVRPTC